MGSVLVEARHVCEVLRDLGQECREVLKKEGLSVQTKRIGVVHSHPLVKVEKQQRQLFLRWWSQLGLSWDARVRSRIGP